MVVYFSILYGLMTLLALWASIRNPKTTVTPGTLWWNSICSAVYAALLFFVFGPLNTFGTFFAFYCVFNTLFGVAMAALGGYEAKRWIYVVGFFQGATILVLMLTVGLYA